MLNNMISKNSADVYIAENMRVISSIEEIKVIPPKYTIITLCLILTSNQKYNDRYRKRFRNCQYDCDSLKPFPCI